MKINEKAKIEGIIRVFRLPGCIKNGSKLLDLVRQYVRTGNKAILEYLRAYGVVLGYLEYRNIIVTRGRSVLAERLAGGVTYTGEINYGALGDDATAPTNADIKLGNEVYRKVAASQVFDNNIAYIDFFYAAGDTDGTYEEFGNFIDGAVGADSGRLWSHIATGGWVKSNTESLFVSCQYTIT